MKSFFRILVMSVAAILVATDLFSQTTPSARTSNTIRVLFTGDLHSCAEKYPSLVAFIKQEREAAMEKGCGVVTLDAGDMAFGTLYSAFYERDAAEYRMLAMAGYDAFVFGNHDFDVGLTSLAYMFYNSRIQDNPLDPATGEKLTFPLNVTANIDPGEADKNFANAMKFIDLQPYTILERASMKIGVFGLLGREAYQMSMAEGKVSYMDPVEAAKKVIPLLKSAGVDFIVAISHSGAMARENSEDVRLARECPEINLIISGHDHEALFTPYMVGNTAIVSAGANGALLGEMDLLKTPEGVLIGKYSLKPVPDDIAPDAGAEILLADLKEKVNVMFKSRYHLSPFSVIDSIASPPSVTTDRNGFNPMGYDVARAIFNCAYYLRKFYLDTSKLVSIVPAGVLRSQLPSGKITYSDVFNALSLGRDSFKNPGSPLVLCFLTGKELKRICEFNASAAQDSPDTFMSFYGLNYTYNSAMPKLFRVKDVYVHGKKIDKAALYPVVTDLYTANNVSLAGAKSYGLLKISPKDYKGRIYDNIAEQCPIRGYEDGWNLDNSDITEWYAYAVYLRDKVILGDPYPVPAGKDIRSHTPYIVLGAIGFALIAAITVGVKAIRRRRKAHRLS